MPVLIPILVAAWAMCMGSIALQHRHEAAEHRARPVAARHPVPSDEELVRMMPLRDVDRMAPWIGARQISERLGLPHNWVTRRLLVRHARRE